MESKLKDADNVVVIIKRLSAIKENLPHSVGMMGKVPEGQDSIHLVYKNINPLERKKWIAPEKVEPAQPSIANVLSGSVLKGHWSCGRRGPGYISSWMWQQHPHGAPLQNHRHTLYSVVKAYTKLLKTGYA